MSVVPIRIPDLEEKALTWPNQAEAVVIDSPEAEQSAADLLIGIKSLSKEIADHHDPLIKKAHETHRALIEAKKKLEAPLIEAEGIIKRKLGAYREEVERREREEQRRREEEARKAEEERRLQEAVDLAEQGEEIAAEEVLAAPILPVALPPPPPVQKATGVAYRETWSAVVKDKLALVRFVAENPRFLHLIDANGPNLNALARQMKADFDIPGVQATGTKTVAAGGRR